MTRIRKLATIAVLAVVAIGVGMVVVAAMNDDPVYSCVDMNGKRFEWRWASAPFASTCGIKRDPR